MIKLFKTFFDPYDDRQTQIIELLSKFNETDVILAKIMLVKEFNISSTTVKWYLRDFVYYYLGKGRYVLETILPFNGTKIQIKSSDQELLHTIEFSFYEDIWVRLRMIGDTKFGSTVVLSAAKGDIMSSSNIRNITEFVYKIANILKNF